MALQKEYAGKVSFLILDVTNDGATERSRAAAESAGLGTFFRENDSTGVVTVFGRDRAKVVATLAGETDVSRYRAPLAAALGSK